MSQINKIILQAVKEAGHWGVLRNGYISPEVHEIMAERAGMSVRHFRNVLFADGVRKLDQQAILSLVVMYGYDIDELEAFNSEIAECGKQKVES